MDVSIIIVSYNTRELTKQCLESVLKKTEGIDFEIIVVDNNSQDSSGQMLKKEFPNVKLIESEKNLGFGKANNLGIDAAIGRNIFLLNPDTILINNAIKILSDYLDKNENIGICGGNLYDEEMNPSYSFDKIPSLLQEINILLGNPNKLNKNRNFNFTFKPMEVGYITGADMMIKKSLLDKIGYFDPDFFMYYEETELTWRIKKSGYKIINIPNAKIIHLEGKSFNCNLDKIKRILTSRKLFFKKTHGNLYRLIADCIFHLTAISRITVFYILGNKEKNLYWKYILKNI